jgi:signal transduction histidine kinase
MTGQRVRILLVEDNPVDARLVQGVLSKFPTQPFNIEWVDRLSTALDRMASDRFEAILLDLSLPDSEGLETFRRMQAQAPSMPIVILTSFDDEDMAVRAVAEGAQDYLIKAHANRHLLARALRYAIERKRIDEELHRLNTELDRRVLERTADLHAANKELEAFTHTVSHNLRAPLRHLDGFAHLLLQNAPKQLDATCTHYVHAISECALTMGRLIDNLLAYARAGRTPLSIQHVELRQLVDAVRQDLATAMDNRQITWIIGALPTVEADPALLRQVLRNLLSNAVKFTRQQPAAEIEIGQAPGAEGEIVIFVRDNGVGFEPAYTAKLFGVFQRLHSEEEFEGTGIGLAMVQRIIQRHGGRVWAQGQLGHGATFSFSLKPARPEPQKDDAG